MRIKQVKKGYKRGGKTRGNPLFWVKELKKRELINWLRVSDTSVTNLYDTGG